MSEIIGKIVLLKDTEKISETFSKREIVVETDQQYKQKILIQFVKDKCNLLDVYKVGDIVNISYNLQGREWVSPQGETKYFNQIQGWNINKGEREKSADSFMPDRQPINNALPEDEDESSDLPF